MKCMLSVVAAVAAGLAVSSAEAARAWNTVNGGFGAGSTWSSKLTSAYSIGVWVKNVTAQYYLYLSNIHGVSSLGASNNDDQLFFSTTQVDAEGGTNVTVKVVCPLTVFRRRGGTNVPTLNDGDWHFIVGAFNYDATDSDKCFQRLYVDGVQVAEKTVAYGSLVAGKRTLCFGGANDGGTDSSYWMNWQLQTGRYAEITLWDRGLASEEVAGLFLHRASGDEPGLVAYWPLDTPTISSANMAKNGMACSIVSRGGGTQTVVEDADFFENCRCVVSPQWAAEHGYVPAANASYRTWDDPAVDIQAAVDRALVYEQVRVMPGTYTLSQQIAVTNANRTVTSYDPETGKADRDGTVIDCGGSCSGFKIGKGATDDSIEVRGFTVRNGAAASGGGVYINGGASSLANLSKRCRLADCTITNCTATSNGGGVRIEWGLVTNCLITGCSAYLGGGMCNTRGVQYGDARANAHQIGVADDCDFVGNEATKNGGGYGNATDYNWYTMYARNCRFRNNKATNRGGHIDAGAGSRIEGCTFSGSASAGYGSCMNFGSGNNSGCPPLVTNCFFVGATSGAGYGYLHPSSNTKILNCVVTNNKYTTAFVFNENGANVVVRQCLLADNGQSAVITGHNSTSAFIENCTVAMTGAMNGTSASSSKVVFRNCILGGTVTSSAAHQAIVSNCVVKALGGTPHGANFNVYPGRTPGFKNAATGDYTLKPGAFAREKGVKLDWMTDSSLDLAGNPRLVNRDGVAYAPDALPDLGCYECQEQVPGLLLLLR